RTAVRRRQALGPRARKGLRGVVWVLRPEDSCHPPRLKDNPMRLAGKVAIVTGGGSGFGEGIVTKFAAEGAQVLVADRDEANAKRVAEATGAGWLRADVTKAADVKAMVEA